MCLAGLIVMAPPCHTPMPATKKFVIQYPPGTGFAMAMFPPGHQVISLFVLATVVIFGFGLLAIFYATTALSILTTAAFADLALYMMINPSKASYSMAPTMVVCALAGFLTAHLFVRTPQRHRISMTILTGSRGWSRRQFQAGKSVSLRRLFPVFWLRLFAIEETRSVPAGRIVLAGYSWRESCRP